MIIFHDIPQILPAVSPSLRGEMSLAGRGAKSMDLLTGPGQQWPLKGEAVKGWSENRFDNPSLICIDYNLYIYNII
jgi:hypothetical protein